MSGPDAAAPAAGKKTLLEQVLVVENCAERLQLSLDVLASRGTTSAVLEHERDCLKQTARALDLLMLHEKDIVALIRGKRENAARTARGSSRP